MYTIGEFSKIVKLSSRMLRHYDKENLLKPTFIDDNKYRYYSKEQVQVALKINRMKNHKFSLEEIKYMIEIQDETIVKSLYENKINELSNAINEYSNIIDELKYYHDRVDNLSDYLLSYMKYDIFVGKRNNAKMYTRRVSIDVNEMDKYVDKLFDNAYKNNIILQNAPGAIFLDEEYNPQNCDVMLFAPIISGDMETHFADYLIIEVEEHCIAMTLHFGSYDDIGLGYIEIQNWIKENDYEIIGNSYEIYLKSIDCRCKEHEYITQICYPIQKKIS